MIMYDFMVILRALADENRVRILLALSRGELCLCQIIELLHLAPSTVSKHMSILRQAHLVKARKQGRWVYYSLPGEDAPAEVAQALAWVRDSLAQAVEVAEDAKCLTEILKVDPEQLCRKNNQK